jgi:hypothetical protein
MFCVYEGELENSFNNGFGPQVDKTSGRIMEFGSQTEANQAYGWGAWAVTARCPIDPETEVEEEC